MSAENANVGDDPDSANRMLQNLPLANVNRLIYTIQ